MPRLVAKSHKAKNILSNHNPNFVIRRATEDQWLMACDCFKHRSQPYMRWVNKTNDAHFNVTA